MRNKVTDLLITLLSCVLLLSACGSDTEVASYTSHGTPIVSADVTLIDWKETDYSECFSEIGYDEDNSVVYVRFKDSGIAYRYLEFPSVEWEAFASADSPGSWYNENIKGHYHCERIAE